MERDSHALCPLCNHEYGYHGKEGCQKECCSSCKA